MIRWAAAALIFLSALEKPTIFTAKEILERNREAVVQIFVNGQLSGCGFIVSADGLVLTANHVVTSAESRFDEVFPKIEVKKIGQRLHSAMLVARSKANDTALLRIIVDGLPHVTLGDIKTLRPSDAVTMITFLPDSRSDVPLVITGSVSGIVAVKGTNAMIVQMPIRKGFSGSPVFDESGEVIGIVTTRLVGISPDLDNARRDLNGAKPYVHAVIAGTDFGKVTLGLIDSLDADLVSGLGSAIDIAYAKQMVTDTEKNKKR